LESTGLFGRSTLRRVDIASGKISKKQQKNIDIAVLTNNKTLLKVKNRFI
jgi:glutamine cyclotransferase